MPLMFSQSFRLNVSSGGAPLPNNAPVFTSGGTANFDEETTGTVYTAVATDADLDTIVYGFGAGDDDALFTIDSSTGVVEFITPPDFDAPGDFDANNVYDIEVTASDGIATTTLAVAITVDQVIVSRTPSYYNPGARDYRIGLVTLTTDLTGSGAVTKLQDGDRATGYSWTNGQAVAGKFIKWDYGVGIKKRITEIRFLQAAANGHGTWKFQGSDDDSAWTDVSTSDFTLGGSTDQTIDNGIGSNATFYRYYRLLGISGTTSSIPSLYEFMFEISEEGGENDTPAWTGVGGAGFRTDIITVTETVGLGASASVVVDGLLSNAADFDGSSTAGRYLQIAFPVGIEMVIDGVRLRQSNSAAQGTWKLQRSDDASAWTDVGASFTLGGATLSEGTITTDNVPARYWRVTTVSGSTSNSPFIREFEFRTAYVE